MKKILLILLLPFLIATLSSFNSVDVQDHVVKMIDYTDLELLDQSQKGDSVLKENEVNIKFDPATIIVDDIRGSEQFTELVELSINVNARTARAMENLSENVSVYLDKQEERRWETVWNRLSMETGYTINELKAIPQVKAKVDKVYGLWQLLILLSFFIYTLLLLISDFHLFFNWKYFLMKLGVVAFILGSILFIVKGFIYTTGIIKVFDMTMQDYRIVSEQLQFILSG